MSSLPAKMKNQSKMKALEWLQHISHCKSIGIFPDTQGQLSLQSVVISDRNSSSVENLWLSLLPAKMKQIRLKMEALEWSQGYMSIFQMFNVR